MFILSKFISYFLLPPGLFLVSLFLTLFFLTKKLYKVSYIFISSLILSLYLLSINPVADRLLIPLESKYPAFEENGTKQYDSIILLGGGTYLYSPEYDDHEYEGTLREDSLKRTYYTAYLSKKLNLPVIVSGGNVYNRPNQSTEADIMKETLIDLGIPEEEIFIEGKSRDTYENLYYSKQIMEDQGFDNVLLVTSAYHMNRSMLVADKNKVQVTAAPTDYKTKRKDYFIHNFFPSMADLENSNKAIREYIGLFYYFFR